MQLAVQVVLDISNHILAGEGAPVHNYTEVFDQLAAKGILPQDFAPKSAAWPDSGISLYTNIRALT